MITHVAGTVLFKGLKSVVIEAGDMGYEVRVGSETLQKIPEKGGKVNLWTHLAIREDAHELYGFFTKAELDFFTLLIGIPGIGPKSALGVLAVAPLDTLKSAIGAGEATYLIKVSGIGKKMAEKIILELGESLAGDGSAHGDMLAGDTDVLEALLALGYTRKQAREAIRRLPAHAATTNDRVKEALKVL